MPHRTIEGQLNAGGLKFAILVSRFNSFITERLQGGALDALARSGAAEGDIEIVRVPGSWEMPAVAAELIRQKRHDALICLGCVIRGETPHFDYVAGEAAQERGGEPRAAEAVVAAVGPDLRGALARGIREEQHVVDDLGVVRHDV